MNKSTLRILAIDDNPDNLTTLKAVMQDALPGCTLCTALNGQKGLELAVSQDPDVILLDIVMPGMDGFEVCHRLKADQYLREIPVVFLTALKTDRNLRIRALESGAEAFLSKPFDEQELIAQILAMGKIRAASKMQRTEKERLEALVNERTSALQLEIIERKRNEDRLRLAASVFTHAREGILITDVHGTIIDVNDTFSEITGFGRNEALGQNPRFMSSGRHTPEFYANLWRDLLQRGFWSGEVWNKRKNGECYPELRTISAVRDAHGKPQQYVALFSDITATKEYQRQLEHMANYDVLTDLPNRATLQARTQAALDWHKPERPYVGVLLLSLSNLKTINESCGHAAGDDALKIATNRMQAVMGEHCTLGRFGGNEFGVLCAQHDSLDHLVDEARMLLTALAEPIDVGGERWILRCFIGIAVGPDDGLQAQDLMQKAESALHNCRANALDGGVGGYLFFRDGMNRRAVEQLRLESDLRQAIANDELVLFYQPKLPRDHRHLAKLEALLRWQHPTRGLVPPMEFIPALESSGLIVPAGWQIVRTACAEISRLHDLGLNVEIAVNVSARQFEDPSFCEEFAAIVQSEGVNPSQLEIEVTESMAMRNPEATLATLTQLHDLGFKLAIDDFGTGYSSLAYLSRFPMDVIKIDRAFVKLLPDNDRSVELVKAIVSMSHAMGAEVVAEGVETRDQADFLDLHGCDYQQGFLHSKPVPSENVAAVLLGLRVADELP